MGENSGDIRKNVEQTRDQMGNTLDALTSKLNVPTRVKDTLDDTADNVKRRLQDGAASIRGSVDDVSNRLPDPETVKSGLKNPIALSAGLVAVGVLVGLVVPLSDLEKRRLRPLGADIARRAVEARDEIIDQSKLVVSETVSAAQESVQKHGQEMATNLGVTTPS